MNNFDINPGVGVGPFQIGMTSKALKLLLSPNSDEEDHSRLYNVIKTEAIWFYISKETNLVDSILLLKGFTGKIVGQIGIGSPTWKFLRYGGVDSADDYKYCKHFRGMSFGTTLAGGFNISGYTFFGTEVVDSIQIFSNDQDWDY